MKISRRRAVVFSVGLAMFCSEATAQVVNRETATVAAATGILADLTSSPKRGIPAPLIRDAAGVAIVPGMIKAGFLVGVRHGRGVIMIREAEQGWSNPLFMEITGGSLGFQAGAQSIDLILVFKTRRGVERFLEGRGKFTLGADASAAAGPVGGEVSAATDAQLRSEIYSYSRSRGLFAGVSLDGSGLKLDWAANANFYGRVASPGEIVIGKDLTIPPEALELRKLITTVSGQTDEPKTESSPVIIESRKE